MTTFFQQEANCANCRKTSEQPGLGSTNAFGSPDVDLRPPEMRRSTMRVWLQSCPHCDYTAPNISVAIGDLTLVASAAYRDTLNDKRFHPEARPFLAHALLTASTNAIRAAHARLHAAWVCDDKKQTELAAECRRLAVECFSALKPFEDSEPGVTQGAVFVDVLRRAGELERAAAECAELLARRSAVGPVRQVLEYQVQLVGKKDMAAHTIEECVK